MSTVSTRGRAPWCMTWPMSIVWRVWCVCDRCVCDVFMCGVSGVWLVLPTCLRYVMCESLKSVATRHAFGLIFSSFFLLTLFCLTYPSLHPVVCPSFLSSLSLLWCVPGGVLSKKKKKRKKRRVYNTGLSSLAWLGCVKYKDMLTSTQKPARYIYSSIVFVIIESFPMILLYQYLHTMFTI
jgi:hypothetical protein